MPVFFRIELPVSQIGFSICIPPWLAMYYRWNKWLQIVASLKDSLACFNDIAQSLLPHQLTLLTFMHSCIDFNACPHRHKRGSVVVKQICIVEYGIIAITLLSLDMAILLMNPRRRGPACALLMNGLSYDDAWIFRSEVHQQWAGILHNINELFITSPCAVKQYIVAEMTNLIQNLTCIIDSTIISTHFKYSQTNWSLSLSLNRILFSYQLADVFFIDALSRNTTD